jgi:hypothetical protein
MMEDRHDSKGVHIHTFEPGQLVWFSVKNISLRHPTARGKLLPRYMGPVRILELVGKNAARLEMPASLAIHATISVTLLKPYKSRSSAVPPVLIDGEQEWVVDKISNHNLVKAKKGTSLLEFEIVWKGSYENSWHEFKDLEGCIDLLERYLMSDCTKSKRVSILRALTPHQRSTLSPSLQNILR